MFAGLKIRAGWRASVWILAVVTRENLDSRKYRRVGNGLDSPRKTCENLFFLVIFYVNNVSTTNHRLRNKTYVFHRIIDRRAHRNRLINMIGYILCKQCANYQSSAP